VLVFGVAAFGVTGPRCLKHPVPGAHSSVQDGAISTARPHRGRPQYLARRSDGELPAVASLESGILYYLYNSQFGGAEELDATPLIDCGSLSEMRTAILFLRALA
jgi:hypothetical protein